MRREVSGCVGCGLLPCFHCTEEEIICDGCGTEIAPDEVYGIPTDEEDYCIDCLKDRLTTDAPTPTTCPYCGAELTHEDSVYSYSRTLFTVQGKEVKSGGACDYCFDEEFLKGD